jgi:2-haloacid dehalogenase
MRRFGQQLNFSASAAEQTHLAESVRNWKPFAETSAALARLQQKYKLVILSNVDDELFAASARQMNIIFDIIVTAQQCHSYKPSLHNFHVALERIGEPKERVLHVAQSLLHDHAPAKHLGFTTVWVNRSDAKIGVGLDVHPDLVVPDLKTLAKILIDGGR